MASYVGISGTLLASWFETTPAINIGSIGKNRQNILSFRLACHLSQNVLVVVAALL